MLTIQPRLDDIFELIVRLTRSCWKRFHSESSSCSVVNILLIYSQIHRPSIFNLNISALSSLTLDLLGSSHLCCLKSIPCIIPFQRAVWIGLKWCTMRPITNNIFFKILFLESSPYFGWCNHWP